MQEPKTILYAEDDPDDRLFFEEALQFPINGSTYQVRFADNGMEVLRHLEIHPLPDILFLDLNMPVKTGLECLRDIKLHRQMADLPIVIFTTSRNQREINDAFELGATIYAIKPTNIHRLSHILDICLSRINHCNDIIGAKDFVVG